MTTFATIDIANLTVAFHATEEAATEAAEERDHFLATSAQDLQELTGPQQVALYNATAADLDTNITTVNKFSGKEVGARRLWANLEDLREVYLERHAQLEKAREAAKKGPANKEAWEQRKADAARDHAAPAKATDYPAPAKAARRNTGITLQPKPVAYPCRWGSKQAILVDMLSRKQGATMAELIEALSGGNKPWQEVTVKSGLNWDMNKIKGYGIRTTKRGDDDCYHLVLPEGLAAPLPHKKTKAQLDAENKG